MKPKPTPRARRMWANYHVEGYVCLYSTKGRCMNSSAEHIAIPVAVIPLDDPESLVNKAVKAFFRGGQLDAYSDMRAALTAIGVLPKRKGGRK